MGARCHFEKKKNLFLFLPEFTAGRAFRLPFFAISVDSVSFVAAAILWFSVKFALQNC
jgi:hypothetical protein